MPGTTHHHGVRSHFRDGAVGGRHSGSSCAVPHSLELSRAPYIFVHLRVEPRPGDAGTRRDLRESRGAAAGAGALVLRYR